MCELNQTDRVRIRRCGHGTYHLTVNAVTLHISENELSAIVRAANRIARREPTLLGKMLLDETYSAHATDAD